jgi:hypothetical protein
MEFRLNPMSWMAVKVGARDKGMAIAAIAVARQLRKNRNTTSAASPIPSISTWTVAV